MPWTDGKSPMTTVYMSFLATWARRLSWTETGRAFTASWDEVRRAVVWVVHYGLQHRNLDGIEAIGVDEVQWARSAVTTHAGVSTVEIVKRPWRVDRASAAA